MSTAGLGVVGGSAQAQVYDLNCECADPYVQHPGRSGTESWSMARISGAFQLGYARCSGVSSLGPVGRDAVLVARGACGSCTMAQRLKEKTPNNSMALLHKRDHSIGWRSVIQLAFVAAWSGPPQTQCHGKRHACTSLPVIYVSKTVVNSSVHFPAERQLS